MKTRLAILLAVVLAFSLASGTYASNMGFKLNLPITGGVSKYVSLPYFNSYTDATSLRNDVIAAGGLNVSIINFNEATQLQEVWSGGGAGEVNFAITPGKAYIVNTSNATTWIIVGSHDDTLAVGITGGVSKYLSCPYHTTATTAGGLLSDIQADGGLNVSLFNFNESTQLLEVWSGGGAGETNFGLVAGKGYIVNTSNTFSWTPSHF